MNKTMSRAPRSNDAAQPVKEIRNRTAVRGLSTLRIEEPMSLLSARMYYLLSAREIFWTAGYLFQQSGAATTPEFGIFDLKEVQELIEVLF